MSSLISVILPVYNAAPFVSAAVRSVLTQTDTNFELIIVDDGSTDASLEVLRGLASTDSRIRLSSRPNKGIVATLSEMVTLARGELIARMDADDICRPHRLARQRAYLDEHPDCVAVGSKSLFIDPDGLPICEFISNFTHDEVDRALMAPEIGILHPTLMMRRSALDRAGGYRNGFPHVEDLDLFLRLGEIGRLANLPEVLLDYRNHLSSISHRNSTAQSQAGQQAVREACRRRGLPFDPAEHSAVVAQPETIAELHRKWAWWALNAGHRATAQKHALAALRRAPFSRGTWHLIASTWRPAKRVRAPLAR